MTRKKQCKVGQAKSETIAELPIACSDEHAALAFMEKQRWGDTPCCPKCGDVDVYRMRARNGIRNKDRRWRCRGCGVLYTVRTGTVLEDSRIPLMHWCYAFWRASTSKKGVAAKEIQRQTGLSYKASLFLLNRVRFAMAPTNNGPRLTGTVEADETWIGGKPRHRFSQSPQNPADPKRNNYLTRYERKTAVFAAVQRNGQARVRVIPEVTSATLGKAVAEHIHFSSRLMTDEHGGYRKIGEKFKGGHCTIQHKRNVYVRGDVTTNTVEGFFGNLKRGINGIYHSVSKKHLQRYLDEFEFRYNHRALEDGDRVIAAIRGAEGKRLTYREPLAKSA